MWSGSLGVCVEYTSGMKVSWGGVKYSFFYESLRGGVEYSGGMEVASVEQLTEVASNTSMKLCALRSNVSLSTSMARVDNY